MFLKLEKIEENKLNKQMHKGSFITHVFNKTSVHSITNTVENVNFL